MRRFLLSLIAFSCCAFSCCSMPCAFAEETLEDMIKKTDMNNVESVFLLGEWCEKNNKPSTARKYYSKILQMDKDHEATRAKFGQVRVGDRWITSVSAAGATAGGGPKAEGGGGGSGATASGANSLTRQSSGPGPTTKDIKWDLTVPPAKRENKFIEAQFARMQKSANESDDMDSAVLTLYRDDTREEMVPLLCQALTHSDFTDLYGTSLLIMKFLKDGNMERSRQLFGFLDQASERCKRKDDLEMFAYVAPMMKDRRVIPRLIELMGHSEAAVSSAARKSFSQMTLQPDNAELTAEKAKKWWDSNHDVSPKVYLSEQLKNEDPLVVISAAEGLYELRDKAVVPAIIKVLSGNHLKANEKGLSLMVRITGNDWGYSPKATPEERAKVIAQMEKWWKQNGENFEWVADRNAKPEDVVGPADDTLTLMINQLASVEGNNAQQAEQNLIARGNEAVKALLLGLKNPSVIIRRKSNEILKTLSKKDVGYDPRADEVARDKSIKAWSEWAKSQEGFTKEKAAQ
jgi:PBS lyase HEAT-like repeat